MWPAKFWFKLLLVVATICLGFNTPSLSGAPSFVQVAGQTNNAAAGTITAAFSGSNTAGNFIVVAVCWGDKPAPGISVSDTLGNSYSVATSDYDTTNRQGLAIMYVPNIRAGSNTVTATFNQKVAYRRIIISEYSGVAATAPLDVTKMSKANGTTASDGVTSTAATTTTNGDLIFGAVMDDTGQFGTITAGTGFIKRAHLNNMDMAVEDRVQPGAGSIAATFTFSRADRYLAQMAAFKPGSTGPTVPSISSLGCAPASLNSGATTTCTVTLTQVAPAGGSAVALSSNSTLLPVPASVTVPAGAVSATFTATAGTIPATQTAVVTATLNGSQSTTLTLLPPISISSLGCTPASVNSGATTTCTVTLTQAAPAGGSTVALSSDNALLAVPASVTVPANAVSATFTATAGTIPATQAAVVTATLNGSQSTTLTLLPLSISSLGCTPASVNSGVTTTCTVTLTQAAASGGSTVALSSNNTLLLVPVSVTVPAGAVSATFSATAGTIPSTQTAVVTATLNGSQSTTLTLLPSVTSTISFVQVAGQTSDTSAGTIAGTFSAGNTAGNFIVVAVTWGDQPAPTISLSDTLGNSYSVATNDYDTTNRQGLAIVYAPNIRAGTNTVTATFGLNVAYRRIIISEYTGVAATAPLDVTKMSKANGTTASDGVTSTAATTTTNGDLIFGAVMDDSGLFGTITEGTSFTRRAYLNNMDMAVEDRVQPVTGSIAATFTFSRADQYLAQMAAFKPGGSGTTVPSISSLVCAPTSLNSGATTTCTVTLTQVAPAGGSTVALSSNNTRLPVPASVAVPAGAVSATFTATAGNIPSTQTAVVTATLNGNRTMIITLDSTAPTVPAGLTALATSPSQINLSWTASTDDVGVVGYKIYRDGAQIATTAQTVYSDRNLQPGTYSYAISAYDAAGNESNRSAPVSATTHSSSGTVLSNLAASMQPGTWAQLDTENINPVLTSIGISGMILGYAEYIKWDPVGHRLYFLGGDHNNTSVTQYMKHVQYDEASNSWTQLPTKSWFDIPVGLGRHGLDHAAIDPAHRYFYFRKMDTLSIYRYHMDTGVWTQMPDNNVIGYNSCCVGIEYFPELQGVLWAGVENGNNGGVTRLKDSTGQWDRIGQPAAYAMGGYENFAEYNPVNKVMLFGGGQSGAGGRNIYKLDASGTVTAMRNAPFDLAIEESVVTVDPVSGKYLVLNANKQFYVYDVTTDNWTLQTSSPPLSLWTSYSGFPLHGVVAGSIDTYSVNIFVSCDGPNNCSAYLYKHSPTPSNISSSTPTEPTVVSGSDTVSNESSQSLPSSNATSPGAAVLPLGTTPGLIGYWAFDEGASFSSYDFSGKGNSGILINNPLWTTGKVGKGIRFNTMDDDNATNHAPLVLIGRGFDIPRLPFTFTAWINPASFADWRGIFSKRDSYSPSAMRLDVGLSQGNGQVYLTTARDTVIFDYAPPTKAWTHIAVVATSTGTSLYINGILRQTLSSVRLGDDATANTVIGGTGEALGGDNNAFKGIIDEVRVYDRALSTSEVQQIYAINTNGTQ